MINSKKYKKHDKNHPASNPNNHVAIAIQAAGGPQAVAREVGLTIGAIRKWAAKGVLPQSEWTGTTQYAKTLHRLANKNLPRGESIPFNNIKPAVRVSIFE